MVQTRSATKKELPAANDGNVQQRTMSKRAKSGRTNPAPQKAASRRSTKRGRLSMLPEMNLDVLCHILSYLHPMDLLNLAWLTKSFRQFLLSKSHAFLWMAARKEVVGLPECPPDLSEPEYARLAFYPHCHNCDRIVHTVYWNIRRRYCSVCGETRLLGSHRYHANVARFLPSEYLKWTSKKGDEYVDKEQYDVLHEEYRQLAPGKEQEFATRRLEMLAKIKEHANQCKQWLSGVTAARDNELSKARDARNQNIFSRLRDAGYDREVRCWGENHIIESRPEVFRTSKRLTDKDWEVVLQKLEPTMIELRERRLEKEVHKPRRQLLTTIYDLYLQHPAPEGSAVDMFPSTEDVSHFTPFEAILQLPEDEIVDATTFKPAFDQLPALTKRWREEIDLRLASLINFDNPLAPKSPTQAPSTWQNKSPEELLRLACAVFALRYFNFQSSETRLFTYPHVLTQSSILSDPQQDRHQWFIPPSVHYTVRNWSSLEMFPGALHVIRACGLDPRTATVDDMDSLNPRLTCNVCHHYTTVLHWRSAILHAAYVYHGTTRDSWTVLDKELLPMIEAKEQDSVLPEESPSQVYCALCQRRALPRVYSLGGHFPSLPIHLGTFHGVKDTNALQENVHYIVPRDGLETCRRRNLYVKKNKEGTITIDWNMW